MSPSALPAGNWKRGAQGFDFFVICSSSNITIHIYSSPAVRFLLFSGHSICCSCAESWLLKEPASTLWVLWMIAYCNILVIDQRQICSQKSISSATSHSHGVFLIETVQSDVFVLWVMQTAEIEDSLAAFHPGTQRHTCVHVRTVIYSSLV